MTGLGTSIGALIAAGAVAAGGVFGDDSPARPSSAAPTALVVDAADARDGRDLVHARLEAVDAEIRLPRSAAEARTNVRYFDALGYRVVVAGPDATEAASDTGIPAVRAAGVSGALEASTR
jgi:hypothetical protein